MTDFPPSVVTALGCYVYRLIDPRNDETFYVGKGRGSRVLQHCRAAVGSRGLEDDVSLKIRRIREITALGLEVGHVIHRHGLDDTTAFEVEAALIDAYPGLANQVGGVGSNERGCMHVADILLRHNARPVELKHNVMAITVNRSVEERSLYDAVRYAWAAKKERAVQVKYVFAVERGLITGVFEPREWLIASRENFPALPEDRPKRIGFEGEEAPAAIQRLYLGRLTPPRKKGETNPVRYLSVS